MGEQNAGRELDALVAEKVMGWDVVWHTDPNWKGIRQPYHVVVRAKTTDRSREDMLPRFSTRIADAWAVVDRLMERAFDIHFCESHESGSCCTVRLGFRDDLEFTVSDCQTMPHAICLAALKAVASSSPSGAPTT